jgi:hypothetical protein
MGQPLADTYGLADNDTFNLDGENLHDRIQILVDKAHADGILSVPGHDLILWQVGDEGFLLTVDPPSPPRLCSFHLCVEDLLPDRTSGSVAALAVLMAVGQAANQLLDEQAHATARTGAPFPPPGSPPCPPQQPPGRPRTART